MAVFGLTGGIGSGKSAVARLFRELGVDVLDADQVAREVVDIGSQALTKIAEHFGPEILNTDLSLNRAKLRNIVFSSQEQKKWLENLLHPLIRKNIEAHLAKNIQPYQILESPLLLETNQANLVNKIIVVDVERQVQLQRACRRDGVTEEQVNAIIDSQMSRQERLNRADFVIDNNGEIAILKAQVATLHQQLTSIAKSEAS